MYDELTITYRQARVVFAEQVPRSLGRAGGEKRG
jgi:hypothetical protein